jgi:phenazine biosynthesis protein phzE
MKPYAFIEKDERMTRYQGDLHHLKTLEELRNLSQQSGKKIVFALPFHLINQKGPEFQARGDEPILALEVCEEVSESREVILECLQSSELEPDGPVTPSVSNADFEGQVEAVQERIKNGDICQAIISRRFEGKFKNYSPGLLQEIYRRLLQQRGQYMTLLLHTPETSLIGASPERHLEICDGKITMNPIAGTLLKGELADFEERLFPFLEDEKEINELYQVLDEELKMMANVCPKGGKITGPRLRETGAVIHTEYLLEGENGIDSVEALRETLHAPTLVGGPLPSASRAIHDMEPESRRYYGGEIGVLSPDGNLDSAIAIRVAEVSSEGHFAVQAGAGIVRDSVPAKEAAETVAKAGGALKALTGAAAQSEVRYLDTLDPERLEQALERRNRFLSHFHLDNQSELPPVPELAGKKITIVNNEDNFAFMLGHMAERMGCEVEVTDTFSFDPETAGRDLVILGPGPGDINNAGDPRMTKLLSHVGALRKRNFPTLGVCLGHQAIAKQRGMDVVKREVPTQGMQREINIFSRPEKVGFYNSFEVRGDDPSLEFSRDEDGAVTAMRAEGMAGYQFHPESVMSQNGYRLLKEALCRLIAG